MKFITILLLLFINTATFAQQLPKKKALMGAMVLTNDYFMKKWPDVGQVIVSPDRTRPSNIWTRGVYYEGLMELYKLNPKKEYLAYMTTWGEFHRWGLRNGTTTRNGDDQCCGQTYIDLYLMDKQSERIKDIKATMDNMIATPKSGSFPDGDWTWVDALQMAMPVFARLGVLYQDDSYYEKMYQMYVHTKTVEGGNGLYNPDKGLWWRDKDFDPPYQTANGKACYWSRGNGWVLAALVRTLDIMPKNAPYRDEYLKIYLEMVKAIAPLQREDGFWNVNLGDPDDFGGKELTGTSLFVYGMARGVNNGLLDSKTYRPIITKATQAMLKDCVHSNGFLGYVQGTGKEPKDSQPVGYQNVPNFEDFGLGCFLLATAEVYKMKR